MSQRRAVARTSELQTEVSVRAPVLEQVLCDLAAFLDGGYAVFETLVEPEVCLMRYVVAVQAIGDQGSSNLGEY